MILIFGGTTEGKKAAAVCEQTAKPFYYSTKSDTTKPNLTNGIHITGAMNEVSMNSFCIEKNIRLIVNAAHPFAEALHRTIAVVSDNLQIPVVRYERNYPKQEKDLLWFNSYDEAIRYLEKNNIDNLLALTGVNTVSKLKKYWQDHNCWFRILDRDESRSIIKTENFPAEKVIYYRSQEDEKQLLRQLAPEAIITKESGESGGFQAKVQAARDLGIPVLVIKRPVLSSSFIPVYGENGLRKKIEELLPGFFELRTGYTTGTCATAAAKAAFIALLTKEVQLSVDISLPNGESINLPVFSTSFEEDKVACSILKDAGDDPDVTDGLEIMASIQFNQNHNEIRFLQGKGVGIVTLPGLGLEIGGPAINKIPRTMICNEISEVMHLYPHKIPNESSQTGIDVTISVPEGEEVARKTFNPKLGIIGGISIIGTSGIVKPFSSEAFISSIHKEMQVAQAMGCKHIVINSGAKSERFVKQLYPDFKEQAFVHYGNFIGETILIASELDIKQLTLGIMIGKAVKLAEGSLNTHSKNIVMNKDFLVGIARESDCSETTINAIETITLARQLWEIIPKSEYRFFSLTIKMCYDVCKPLFPNGTLKIFLISEAGEILKK